MKQIVIVLAEYCSSISNKMSDEEINGTDDGS